MTPPNSKPETGSPEDPASAPEVEPNAAAPETSTDPEDATPRLRPDGTVRKFVGAGPGAARRFGGQGGQGGQGGGGQGAGGMGKAGVGKAGMMQGGMGARAGMRRQIDNEDEGDTPASGVERPGFGAGRARPMGAGQGMGGGNRNGGMAAGGRKMTIDDAEEVAPAAPARLRLSPPVQLKPQAPRTAEVKLSASAPKSAPAETSAENLSAEDVLLEKFNNDGPPKPRMIPHEPRARGETKGPSQKADRKSDMDTDGKPAGGKHEKQLNPASASYIPAPTVNVAPMRRRHWGLVLLFVLMVVLPTSGYGYYLYMFAADQYESNVGFSSRTEQAPSPFELLGALGGVSASSSSDMDIVYQFIRSQELVERLDAKLGLRKIFSKPVNDPLLTFPPDGPVEDLVDYWKTMAVPNFDRATGLMTLSVFAFDPKDAQDIATSVLAESTAIINDLSKTAQDDTTRYSEESLKKSETRMATAQEALTNFRIANNILDPAATVSGNQAVVNSLVQQLGNAEIDLDMLTGTIPDNDPRLALVKRRIEVIQKRLGEEQSKVGGLSDPGAPNYPKLVTDYQNLLMAQDFAQKAYLTALASYDQAVNDAQHKTRYLATYLEPTLAESSTAPMRLVRVLLTALVGAMAWSILTMVYYALRDRR